MPSKVKLSKIYKEAAQMIERGSTGYCCFAIAASCSYLGCVDEKQQAFKFFEELYIDHENFGYGRRWWPHNRTTMRIIALSLAKEIALTCERRAATGEEVKYAL